MSEDIVHAIVMSFHGSCNCSNSSLGFANPHCDAVEPEQEPEQIKKRHRRTTEREVYGSRGKALPDDAQGKPQNKKYKIHIKYNNKLTSPVARSICFAFGKPETGIP